VDRERLIDFRYDECVISQILANNSSTKHKYYLDEMRIDSSKNTYIQMRTWLENWGHQILMRNPL
jgi:hypothetical protein